MQPCMELSRAGAQAGEAVPSASAALMNVVPGNSAELVLREPLRRGAAGDDVEAALCEAFERHQVETVVAYVADGEPAALRLLNRAGLRFVRTHWSNPAPKPLRISLVYQITRSAWQRRREKLLTSPPAAQRKPYMIGRHAIAAVLRSLLTRPRGGASGSIESA